MNLKKVERVEMVCRGLMVEMIERVEMVERVCRGLMVEKV
jgi:hypothetical protein